MSRTRLILMASVVLGLGLYLGLGDSPKKRLVDTDDVLSEVQPLIRMSESHFEGSRHSQQLRLTASDVPAIPRNEARPLSKEAVNASAEESHPAVDTEKASDAEDALPEDEYVPLEQFGQPYMLTLNESDFHRLSPGDQERLFTEMHDDLGAIRRGVLDTFDRAQIDMDGGEYAKAEATLTEELDRASQLTANKDGLTVTRLVGIACQQGALRRMQALYSKTNEPTKLQMACRQWQDLETEKEEIRRRAERTG